MSKTFDKMIRKAGDPVLRQVCEPVDLTRDNLAFLADLVTVCRKYRNGRETAAGLAAPQIGVAKRAIVTNCSDGGTIAVRLFVNPVIVWRGAETWLAEEGCLSYPGVKKDIRRHESIELEWIDLKGQPRKRLFAGFHARVIQHECDHLEGVCRVGDDSPPDGVLKPMSLSLVLGIAAAAALGAMR